MGWFLAGFLLASSASTGDPEVSCRDVGVHWCCQQMDKDMKIVNKICIRQDVECHASEGE